MSSNLNNLIQAFSVNKSALEEMDRLLAEELENIVKLDSRAIEDMADRKKLLMARLESSSAECRKQLQSVAAEMLLPQVENVSDILPKLTGTDRNALQKIQRSMQELGAQVNRQLERNRELLENSVALVNNSLQFFNNLMTKRPTYGQQGALLDGAAGIRLLNKEI